MKKIGLVGLMVVFLAVSILSLSGCMMAIPAAGLLASSVMTAQSTTKLVQLGTGGGGEIKFEEPSVLDEELKSIKSLAIYPGITSRTVKLAEILSENANFKIMTPFAVQKILGSEVIPRFENMTQKEKTEYIQKTCDALSVDAIMFYDESGDHGIDMKIFSFKRGETTIKFVTKVFSREKLLWSQNGQIIWKHGAKNINQEEIDRVACPAIADKFLSCVVKI